MAKTIRTRTRREALEISQRKRARTEGKQERSLRRIAIVKQKIQGVRSRLFKWDESLLHDRFSDWGVIVARVKNFNAGDEDGGVAGNGGRMLEEQVSLLRLKYLQKGWEREMRVMIMRILKEMEAFAEGETIEGIAEEVVSYISSNFRFSRQSLTCARTRRVVVFIDVDMVTTREYCIIEDDGEKEDEDKFKEECADLLEQFMGNSAEVGSEEESADLPEQFIRNSAEFGTEETRGEEDEDDDDDLLDQLFEITDRSGEISREEVEEIFMGLYPFENLVEPNPEAIGGEEEDGSSDQTELADIEDTLWRFLKPEEGCPVDKDRSRDCRGLKQVKDAMEIIEKGYFSKDKETDLCSLCLEELGEGEEAVVRTRRCSHMFHRKCLCPWLSIKDSCPICRSRCASVV